jgi:hypothetical protein
MNSRRDFFRKSNPESIKYKTGMKRSKIFFFIVLFSIVWVSEIFAKKNDSGVWLDLAATKKIHSTTIGLVSEIYTRNNSSTLDRLSIGLKGDYSFLPWLSAGTGYVLIDFFRAGYRELADRFYLQVVPSWRCDNFSFSFRERLQMTIFPESRTNAPNSLYWRNRFESSYKENSWKFEPLIDLESMYFFGDNNQIPRIGYRFIIGSNYYPSVNQKIKIYGMLTDGSIVCQYIFGISYEFRL